MLTKTKQLVRLIRCTCIIGVIFSIYAIFANFYEYEQFNDLEKDALEIREKTSDLNEDLYHIQATAMLQLLVVDEDEKSSFQEEYDALNNDILADLEDMEKYFTSSEEQKILHNLYSDYVAFTKRLHLATDISSSQKIGSLQYYVSSVLNNYVDDMNDSIRQLQERTDKKVSERRRNFSHSIQNSLIISVLFSVALIGILFFTSRSIRLSSKNIEEEFFTESKSHRKQIIGMQEKTINDLAELVESRDGSTGFHIKNTAWYVDIISRKLMEEGYYPDLVNEDYCEHITQYAPLHDVGKILVSDAILLKPGKLDEDEFDKMKEHAAQGGKIVARILNNIETPENIKLASDIASYHHEKWDGTGYPFGLSGEQIPLCARIMAVADVFDALISPRIYKAAFPVNRAYEIIQEGAGSHFDPTVVKIFVELRPIVESYLKLNAHIPAEQ